MTLKVFRLLMLHEHCKQSNVRITRCSDTFLQTKHTFLIFKFSLTVPAPRTDDLLHMIIFVNMHAFPHVPAYSSFWPLCSLPWTMTDGGKSMEESAGRMRHHPCAQSRSLNSHAHVVMASILFWTTKMTTCKTASSSLTRRQASNCWGH